MPINRNIVRSVSDEYNKSAFFAKYRNPIQSLNFLLSYEGNKNIQNDDDMKEINGAVTNVLNHVKLESLTEQNMKLINELFTNPPTTTGTPGTPIPIKAKVLLKLLTRIFKLAANLNKTMSEHETNLIMSYPELKHSAEYEDYLKQIQIMNTPTSGDQTMGGARRFTQNGNRLHRKGATQKSRKKANVAKPRLP